LRPSLTLQSPAERPPQAALAEDPPGLDGEPFALRAEQVMHSFVDSTTEQQGFIDERHLR